MLMRYTIFGLLALCLVFPTLTPSIAATLDREQIGIQSSSILKGIFSGIEEGDFLHYSKDFSKSMKDSQTRENFLGLQKNIQKQLGRLKSLEYLGYYVQQGDLITLYKARFSKHNDDVLVKLVFDRRSDHKEVTGLWFETQALEKQQ
jgi:hypothetical protein